MLRAIYPNYEFSFCSYKAYTMKIVVHYESMELIREFQKVHHSVNPQIVGVKFENFEMFFNIHFQLNGFGGHWPVLSCLVDEMNSRKQINKFYISISVY